MLPKPGVRAEVIITQLNDLLVAEGNLFDEDVAAYLSWVHRAERLLCDNFTDVPLERLYTDRFWQVSKGPPPGRLPEMVGLERARQREWLQVLLNRIRERREHFGDEIPTGVLDTNSLLHHQPPDQIKWEEVIGSNARLVVPLRVVQEVDDKKASNSKPLRQRAANRLRQLAGYTLGDGPHEVRPGVDIELVGALDLDPGRERRAPIPADVEILDTCVALKTYNGGGAVYLVTGDLGMRVQAEVRDITVRLMPPLHFRWTRQTRKSRIPSPTRRPRPATARRTATPRRRSARRRPRGTARCCRR